LSARKIAAQAQTLATVPSAGVAEASLATIRDAASRLHLAATRDDVRIAEAHAAAAYGWAPSQVSVRSARRDAQRVPGTLDDVRRPIRLL
jgi:hypothetical protein